MEKKDKKTDDQIMDYIIDLYLEKHPRVVYYSVTLDSTENGEESFYWPMSDKEKDMVREWAQYNEKDKYYTLQDYLEFEEGGPEIIEKLLDVDTPYSLDKVKSCDLNNTAKFIGTKIYVIDNEGKIKEDFNYNVMMNDSEFRQALKLHILRRNRITVNMLTYLMPEFTTEMMRYCVKTLFFGGIDDFVEPFCVEMEEIKNIVKSIMNPQKDELGLFESDDEEIHKIMTRYAFVPDSVELYEDRSENEYCFHVYAYFDGNKLNVEQEKLLFIDSWFPTYTDEKSLVAKANELCKYLDMPNYAKLLEYLKENFNGRSALDDIYEFVKEKCPNIIINE